MCRFIIVGFLLSVVTGCQPATFELTEEQRTEIADGVKQAHRAMGEAWAAEEDVDEFLNHASRWSVPWTGFESFDGVRQMIIGAWEREDFVSSEETGLEVKVLGPDAAALKGTRISTVTNAAGVTQEQTEHFAGVWVREEGEWKLLVIRQWGSRANM